MKELPRKHPPTYFVLVHAELPSIQQWQDMVIYQLMQMLNSTLMEQERIQKFEPIPKNTTRIGSCLAERMPIPQE